MAPLPLAHQSPAPAFVLALGLAASRLGRHHGARGSGSGHGGGSGIDGSLEEEAASAQHVNDQRVYDQQGLEVSQEVANIQLLEKECGWLNNLEAHVDATGGVEAPHAPDYEHMMGQWRAFWQGGNHQPSCRVEALGRSLCEVGRSLPLEPPEAWNLTRQWSNHMEDLTRRCQDERSCLEFARFHENGWLPPLFAWAEHTPGLDGHILTSLLEDPEYESYFAAAGSAAPHFGSPAVDRLWRPQGLFRRKRIQELSHFRVLRHAAGLSVHTLSHLVEFGGGTGETAATARDLGFAGCHVIVDLPPMLLLQRYWLRYSGLPAYMAPDPESEAEAADASFCSRPSILLESSVASADLIRFLPASSSSRSLFIGLWSLTEAGLGARARVWPTISASDYILITFGNGFDGIDNAQHLQQEAEARGIFASHNVLCWNLPDSPGHYYFLAVRKSLGKAQCLDFLNCHSHTVHAVVGRGAALTS